MLVLLPPSEGKTSGGDGPAVDLAGMSFADELTALRRSVGRALSSLCRRTPKKARELLGLSPALDADRLANAELWESPTMPTGHRYTGVLYDALGYPGLPTAARRRADEHVLTLSGLWGVTRPTDQLPAYRIGIGTRLPGKAGLPVLWRPALAQALDAVIAEQGAIDLRSAGYRDMWRARTDNVITVTVLGSSYASKVGKGALVAAMLRAGVPSYDVLLGAADWLGLRAHGDGESVTVEVGAVWAPPALA